MQEELEAAATGINPFDLSRLCRYFSEQSPQPMIVVEGSTHIIRYLNPAFAQLAGRTSNELMGHLLAQAVPEGVENGCLALLDRVFNTGTHENLAEQEHRQLRPLPVYWSYAVWAILGTSGEPVGVLVQVTDSTEIASYRQQASAMNEALLVSATRQHELAEAAELLTTRLQAAVQSRDHFLAIMSHELRNPLAAMSNGLQILKLAGKEPIAAENCQAMLARQLKQMVRLVDDLLDVSRITTGKLELHKERVELASVLRSAVESSRSVIEGGGHELTVALPSDPVLLDADPARLAQVFLNLLNNAAKYSESNGHIHLSARRNGSEVIVSVRDTGIGIPAIYLPHIFDIFVQVDSEWNRSQGGMGIGLSLVKEFVALQKGRVEARSDGPGKGSEFLVYLPTAIDAPISKSLPVVVEKIRGRQRRILVVDDNRDAAESLAMMLEILGHEVRTAHDGEAGVAAAAEFRPELVLMDLGMPRLNGYEAARRIREEPWGREPFLVALTGWGTSEDRQQTRDAGFDRHLVKPVELDTLKRMIAEMPIESP